MKKVLDIQNPILYERFKNLAKKSFTVLDTHSETLGWYQKWGFKLTEGGGYAQGDYYTPDFRFFIKRYKNELTNLPEFALCIEIIQQDNSINKDIDITDFLIQFLIKLAREKEFFDFHEPRFLDEFYKRKGEMFRFNIDNFNKVYSRYEKYLYSERQVMVFVPLRGFKLDAAELDLGNSSKIKRMSAEDVQEFWFDHEYLSMSHDSPGGKEFVDIAYIKFCAYTELKSDKGMRTEFDVIVTSLRLWKEGNIGYDYIFHFSKWNLDSGFIETYLTGFFGHPPVVLKLAEIEEFKNFYEKFGRVTFSDYPFLNMAINRFNYGYERKRREDQFIDYMIAFDALFLKKGDKYKLKRKLSKRIACFLKSEDTEREDLKSRFALIYDKRGKPVHGEPINSSDLKELKVESFIDLISEIEELLRVSIKKFIDLIDQDENYDHEEFLDKLDLNNV